MTERKTAPKAGKRPTRKKAQKKGGLGAGAKSLELDRPMGEALSGAIEAPPPPPPAAAPVPAAPKKPPAPAKDEPPPPPAVPPLPKDAKVDLDLLPWIVKKQLALDTDREDLDFQIFFWIEGKHDRLAIEGYRNDFGKLYVAGPGASAGTWKHYAGSEFAGTPSDEVFQTYRKNIVRVLVRTEGLEIEFSDLADFLEWSNY